MFVYFNIKPKLYPTRCAKVVLAASLAGTIKKIGIDFPTEIQLLFWKLSKLSKPALASDHDNPIARICNYNSSSIARNCIPCPQSMNPQSMNCFFKTNLTKSLLTENLNLHNFVLN